MINYIGESGIAAIDKDVNNLPFPNRNNENDIIDNICRAMQSISISTSAFTGYLYSLNINYKPTEKYALHKRPDNIMQCLMHESIAKSNVDSIAEIMSDSWLPAEISSSLMASARDNLERDST